MRKIIDSNYFDNDELRYYLDQSKSNFVVLCEFAGIESYGSRDVVGGLFQTYSVLSKYPKQVIVLKGVRKISSQKLTRAGFIERMIDQTQTRDFSGFCKDIALARSGSSRHINAIQRIAKDAKDEIDKAKSSVKEYLQAAEDHMISFSQSELRELKSIQSISNTLFQKLVYILMDMTIHSFNDLGRDVKNANWSDISHSVVFRNLLCHYLITLKWHANGNPPSNESKIRNDVYDCGFASYATFFDGLLTNDTKARETFHMASQFLRRMELN